MTMLLPSGSVRLIIALYPLVYRRRKKDKKNHPVKMGWNDSDRSLIRGPLVRAADTVEFHGSALKYFNPFISARIKFFSIATHFFIKSHFPSGYSTKQLKTGVDK